MTERLTKKHDNSIYGNDGCMSGCDTCSWCECRFVHEMIEKLAHYEDLEEQGRIIRAEDGVFPELQRLKFYKANDERTWATSGMDMAEASTRFTVYQKQIDEGRLIKLPCKVGDTVYFIDSPFPAVVDEIRIVKDGIMIAWTQYDVSYELTEVWDCGDFDATDIGKTVFFTREEAEAARKGADHEEP